MRKQQKSLTLRNSVPEQAWNVSCIRERAKSKRTKLEHEERRELKMKVQGWTSGVKKSRQPSGKLQDLSDQVREDYGAACEPKEETIGKDWRQFRSSGWSLPSRRAWPCLEHSLSYCPRGVRRLHEPPYSINQHSHAFLQSASNVYYNTSKYIPITRVDKKIYVTDYQSRKKMLNK